MDPLDDIFADGAVKNTRPVGKFQPKAKPRLRRESSASVPSAQCQSSMDKQETRLTESCRTEKLPEKGEDSFSGVPSADDNSTCEVVNPTLEHVTAMECVAPIVDLHSDIIIPGGIGDWHSCFEKSAAENADIFLGLESLDDFLSQPSATVTSNPESRSPPCVDNGSQLERGFPTSYPVSTDAESSIPPSEMPAHVVSDKTSTEDILGIPVVPSVGESAWVSSRTHASISPNVLEAGDNLSCREAAIFSNVEDFHIDDNGRLETEFQETGPFSSLEILDITSELTSTSRRERAGKFQPKPKERSQKEGSAGIPNLDALKSASCSPDAQPFFPATEYMDEASIPACPSDDANGFSSGGRNNSITTHPMPEPVVNEETTDLANISELDAAIPAEHPEAAFEMPGKILCQASRRAKIGKRKAPVGSGVSPEPQKASTSDQENGATRSLRPRTSRINTHQLVDESEEEGVNDGEALSESPTGSFANEDDNDDEEFQVKDDSNKTKVRRKSKPPGPQKRKPVQKCKQAKQVSDQSTKKPPKKFSHSTQRKRRRVDKVLLETPEDEIDFRKLPIRDLILLAEHKERISNKAATTSETPLMNQSAGTYSAHFDEDVTFTSEQGERSNDERADPRLEETLAYFNYQTYMDKAPSSRWSKQDTELFYEAVRQFGSDFSMIQHIFPGRTRRQVKLKFKKEERQQPLRFREALTNRSKDHTHFQLVIERLQQIATEEKQNSYMDDSIDLTCEDEVTPEANEEVVKSEENEEEVTGDLEPNVAEFQSPEKSEDSEDDVYRWSNYKSEL